jgi:hypothetical protein
MIIGREKEQRELLGLLDKENSQFCANKWCHHDNYYNMIQNEIVMDDLFAI